MTAPHVIAILAIAVALLGAVGVFFLVRTRPGRSKARDRATAVRQANKALAQNPRDAEALGILAAIYYDEQEWDHAASAYAVLLDLIPANPHLNEGEILTRHGLASMQLKRYDAAYRSLVLASRDHDVFEVNFNLGRLELMRKNYERAGALLRAAAAQQPEHLPTARYLGQALYRLKRFTEAVVLLRRVIDVEPDDRESAFTLGQSYYELGQNELASRVFMHLRADPQLGPRAALMAGSLRLKARLYEQAEEDFLIGLRHEQIPPEILLELRYRLAATYAREQKMDKAMQQLLDILRVNPTYKDVGAQVERARELAGNKNLQLFLMATASEFVGLCRRIVARYYHGATAKVTDVNVSRSESADLLAEVRTPKWEDAVLFRFVRTTGQVGELIVRDLHERTKDLHAGRGLCVTAGSFSEGAKAFVEARPIDLVDKEGLDKVLKRI